LLQAKRGFKTSSPDGGVQPSSKRSHTDLYAALFPLAAPCPQPRCEVLNPLFISNKPEWINKPRMLIHHFLENSATRYPDKVAVIHGGERVAYRDLNSQAESLSAHLQANGIAKGDRIAILLENGIDYIIAYYATLKAGAVAAPLNPGLKPDGLQSLLTNLEPAAIISNFKCERLLKAVDLSGKGLKLLIIRNPKQIWVNTPYRIIPLEDCLLHCSSANCTNSTNSITSSDLASIIYTSGSTGQPKGVMLSHLNIVANTKSICQYLEITSADRQMVILPFFYVMGKSLLNTHIAAGATIVLNNQFAFPATVVKQMAEEKVTAFSGVPSTYAYLLHRSPLRAYRDKLPHLRYCSQAGGHMARAVKCALRKALPTHTEIVIMYGATEAAARLAYLPPVELANRVNSIGKAIANVELRVVDASNRILPTGAIGEIVGQGPNIMVGYWRDPETTAKVLSPTGYHTGDLGYCDEEGYFYLTGRRDNLIKVGGHRINLQEIEDAVIGTDLVMDAAVVGISDPLLGNRLVALAVAKTKDISSENIMKACAAHLPTFKIPSEILLKPKLPLKASGKIDRDRCREIAMKNQSSY
jgi:acyl-CoA synthetase (AMP-forming)/AMP-acid ligase II